MAHKKFVKTLTKILSDSDILPALYKQHMIRMEIMLLSLLHIKLDNLMLDQFRSNLNRSQQFFTFNQLLEMITDNIKYILLTTRYTFACQVIENLHFSQIYQGAGQYSTPWCPLTSIECAPSLDHSQGYFILERFHHTRSTRKVK